MSTISKESAQLKTTVKSNTSQSTFEKVLAYCETNRYGFMSMALPTIGCLGAVASTNGFDNLFILAFVVVSTMMSLSLMLAVAPMKWILSVVGLTIFVDLIFVAKLFLF